MHKDLTLEKRIEAELKSYDGLMGIYLDDLKGHTLAIHADEHFETASTCKLYILAALFDKIEKGQASLTDQLVYEDRHAISGSGLLKALDVGTQLSVKSVATFMIIVSDNICTNMMIEYVGLDYINEVIQALGCRDTVLHNPIDFARYPKLGTSTPRDYASMWVRMARGELISPQASAQMLEICKKQHYNQMIVREFPAYFMDDDNYEEELIWVASKSGSMNACRNDGGIVHTPYGDYVIVMFNKNFSDPMYYAGHPATVFGAKVSRLVFDEYLSREGSLSC